MYDEVGPQFAHKLVQDGYSYVDGGWIPLGHVVLIGISMISFTACRLMSTPMPVPYNSTTVLHMVDISTPILRVREEVMMQYNSAVRGESAHVLPSMAYD